MHEKFQIELRKTLNHLYDPDFLGNCWLANILVPSGSYERATKLQMLLEGAITALKPAPDQPGNSKIKTIYKFLSFRYLQQLDQKQVADQLNISRTQLFRVQQSALAALAIFIWDKHGLNNVPVISAAGVDPKERPTPADLSDAFLHGEESTSLDQVLEGLSPLLRALVNAAHASFEQCVQPGLPRLDLSVMALRQLLLTLVNVGLERWHGGILLLEAGSVRDGVLVNLIGGNTPTWNSESQRPLDELAQLAGAQVVVKEGELGLFLHAARGVPVLIVEDNADQATIFERCLADTRYQPVVCANSSEAVKQAEYSGARAVILDVMMPHSDGWSVLQSLRTHSATYHIPIIVSSILPAQNLAKALSAEAFLAKPVKPEELLAFLDRLTASQPGGTFPAPPARE